MSKYRVIWVIDVEAQSATQAARTARILQLDPRSLTTPFFVTPECPDCPGTFHDNTEVIDAAEVTDAIN